MVQIHFITLSSTQLWVKENLQKIPDQGWLLVTADQQTAGLGTQGRVWYSPPGNIYLTLATKLPQKTLSHKVQFAQIAALAVALTLEQVGFSPRLRWVNDVILSDKKVAGILAEIVANNQYLLIGVGINVNLRPPIVKELEGVITSLFLEQKHEFDLEEIRSIFLQKFMQVMDDYFCDRDLPVLMQEIQKRLTIAIGEAVKVLTNEKIIAGIFLGLDLKGQVMLQVDGQVVSISQGRMLKNS
jgi:BirA family biotin operon repressor/biotin-[acetyl-CoA-carboxylase] ligase